MIGSNKPKHKLVRSYDMSTGVIHFADNTKGFLTPNAAAMIEKLIYMVTTSKGNFQEPDSLDNTILPY